MMFQYQAFLKDNKTYIIKAAANNPNFTTLKVILFKNPYQFQVYPFSFLVTMAKSWDINPRKFFFV